MQSATPPGGREINYGIHAVRILAMFLVCLLHTSSPGGLVCKLPNPNLFFNALSATELVVADAGVDLFMLITGYVCILGTWKPKRIVRLWLQVVFYTLAGIVFGSGVWSVRDLYPIPLASGYWYFSAYIGLFFLIPFLNEYITSISKKRFQHLLLVAIVSCSLICPHLYQTSIDGYSVVWMVVMYLTGAYIRLHLNNIGTTKFYLTAYCCLTAVQIAIFGAKNYLEAKLGSPIALPIAYFGYTSVFTYANSVLLFIFFSRLNIRNVLLCKILSFAAPLTFGIYLIHTTPGYTLFIRQLTNTYAAYTQFRCVHAVVSAVVIYVLCSCIDYGRVLLFNGAEHLFGLLRKRLPYADS